MQRRIESSSQIDPLATRSQALSTLRCRAHPSDPLPRARSKRVLVLGDGPDLSRTVLQWFAENEVSLLCTTAELAGLEREDRLLLLELVAEDELTLLDGGRITKVGVSDDGRCEVCLGGPEECCSLYDHLVLCGEEALTCSAPPRTHGQAG